MRGVELIEPTDLYNLLNQLCHGVPSVTNEYYLVLFDPRKLDEYSESHVITAKYISYNVEEGFTIPTNIDYSAVRNLVVIDNRASSLKDISSPAILLAESLWNMGSKFPVKVVKGGYEDFSAYYPFLRSNKMLWTQGETAAIQTYPIEVEAGFLYMGLRKQAMTPEIKKNLKVKAHINLTHQVDEQFTVADEVHGKNRELVPQLLHIPMEDSIDMNISEHFSTCCAFIDQHRKNDGKTVLIYSDLGISRSVTIALCYLMHHHRAPLKRALEKLMRCHHSICPNQTFMKSLLEWEEEVIGKKVTTPQDLGFLSYE